MKRWIAGLVMASVAAACLAGSSRTPQLAELNHVYAVVDPITAKAISGSEYLRRFANFEQRTTVGTAGRWTGRYLYGRETYIEFFSPGDFLINEKPAPAGTWGIAVSGDRAGANQKLASRLQGAGHKALHESATRNFNGRDVPWFDVVTAVSRNGDSGAIDKTVVAWAMEYRPSYFDLPETAKEPAEGPHDLISRERYQSDLYQGKLMRDVAEVHLDIGSGDFNRIAPLLTAAGYRLGGSRREKFASGAATRFRFRLTKPSAQGLRQVRFRLNAPTRRHVETIGRSQLAVGPGATATWTFAPRT